MPSSPTKMGIQGKEYVRFSCFGKRNEEISTSEQQTGLLKGTCTYRINNTTIKLQVYLLKLTVTQQ